MKHAILFWGGWEGHEPKACVDRFVPFLESNGYGVTLSNSLAPCADEEALGARDLIVMCWTMGTLTEAEEAGLTGAVAKGTGLAGWHGGMCDAFRSNCRFQWMTGGQFVAHPGDIRDYRVDIVRPYDPIMAGIDPFTVRTEQYYMHVDPANEVLATTTFDGRIAPHIAGCVMPVAWKRRWYMGKVFYSALGHRAADFDVIETRMIMERGMLWASR